MAARGNRIDIYLSADKTPLIVCGCVIIASICLWTAFFTDDFSLQYVAAYSNIELDAFYKFSSFWGGQKGSLLFWALLLSIYMSVVYFQNRNRDAKLVSYAMAVLLAILIFFLVLINFSTNPFERIPLPPEDGRGLNPLLQNYWMVIHPPTLYLGYVGFTVPFAFAVAALICKDLDDSWIRLTRKWTLISWFFPVHGQLFGASWAYVELGWGGYWPGTRWKTPRSCPVDCYRLSAFYTNPGKKGHDEGLEHVLDPFDLPHDYFRNIHHPKRIDSIGPILLTRRRSAIISWDFCSSFWRRA